MSSSNCAAWTRREPGAAESRSAGMGCPSRRSGQTERTEREIAMKGRKHGFASSVRRVTVVTVAGVTLGLVASSAPAGAADRVVYGGAARTSVHNSNVNNGNVNAERNVNVNANRNVNVNANRNVNVNANRNVNVNVNNGYDRWGHPVARVAGASPLARRSRRSQQRGAAESPSAASRTSAAVRTTTSRSIYSGSSVTYVISSIHRRHRSDEDSGTTPGRTARGTGGHCPRDAAGTDNAGSLAWAALHGRGNTEMLEMRKNRSSS